MVAVKLVRWTRPRDAGLLVGLGCGRVGDLCPEAENGLRCCKNGYLFTHVHLALALSLFLSLSLSVCVCVCVVHARARSVLLAMWSIGLTSRRTLPVKTPVSQRGRSGIINNDGQ